VELTGQFRDPDQVATWRSDDGGAVANEEPSRSLLWPAASTCMNGIIQHKLLGLRNTMDVRTR
jgi:hypothetical protein